MTGEPTAETPGADAAVAERVDALAAEQCRFREDLYRAANELHQLSEQTQDILDSQLAACGRVDFFARFLQAVRAEVNRNLLLRVLRRLAGRKPGAPSAAGPAEAPLKDTALGLVADVLNGDARQQRIVPAGLYRGHEWYPRDLAFSALRRHLRHDAAWRFGPRRVWERARFLFDMTRPYTDLRDKSFCDVGCGVHHPFGTSAVLYVNGARSAVALDTAPIDDSRRAAEALYDLLVDCLAHPGEWHWTDISRETYLARIRHFDLGALRDGDLRAGIGSLPLEHVVGDILKTELAPGSIDLLTSWAVLEHFLDFDAAAGRLHALMSEQGVAFHTVDLTDHRAIPQPDVFHNWSFLAEDEDWSDGLTNRLRFSEIRERLSAAGFTILHYDGQKAAFPEGFRAQLKGRFAGMDDSELDYVSVNCVLRASGR